MCIWFWNAFDGSLSWTLLVKLLSGECYKQPLMISHHWFRSRLGIVRQQAITWANVDPQLCRHMALLGHNELICLRYHSTTHPPSSDQHRERLLWEDAHPVPSDTVASVPWPGLPDEDQDEIYFCGTGRTITAATPGIYCPAFPYVSRHVDVVWQS